MRSLRWGTQCFNLPWVRSTFNRSSFQCCSQHQSTSLCVCVRTRWMLLFSTWYGPPDATCGHSTLVIIVSLFVDLVQVPPGARVRPPTNYWVSYQPTIGYLTNQLLNNYWVSYQPTIGYLTNQLTTFLLSIFPPPWQPMLLMIQVQVQHSFYQFFPPLHNPCLVLGFSFRVWF